VKRRLVAIVEILCVISLAPPPGTSRQKNDAAPPWCPGTARNARLVDLDGLVLAGQPSARLAARI
jgi:hypothetical protein